MRISKLNTLFDDDHIPKVVVEWRKNVTGISNLGTPVMIAILFESMFQLSRETEEHVYMVCLNSRNRPIGIFEISHGCVSRSFSNPREIFMKALLSGAVGIVLVHNHPSGDVTPSEDDIKSATELHKAGEIVRIRLLDSIILGGGEHHSMLISHPEIFREEE